MVIALLFSTMLYAKDKVLSLTHENYKEEILESKEPIVILYSPSSKGLAHFSLEENKKMSYSYRAFERSAKHFSGKVRFAYFDLQSCLQEGWSGADANSHLHSAHIIVGYPTIILYHAGEAKNFQDKELTRMEMGIPFPRAIVPFVKALDFLVEKNILEQTHPPYVLTPEGRIIQDENISPQ